MAGESLDSQPPSHMALSKLLNLCEPLFQHTQNRRFNAIMCTEHLAQKASTDWCCYY